MMSFVFAVLMTLVNSNAEAGSCGGRAMRTEASGFEKISAGCTQPAPAPSKPTRARSL